MSSNQKPVSEDELDVTQSESADSSDSEIPEGDSQELHAL
jgi:hypothetical protein